MNELNTLDTQISKKHSSETRMAMSKAAEARESKNLSGAMTKKVVSFMMNLKIAKLKKKGKLQYTREGLEWGLRIINEEKGLQPEV